jgi:RHS repeat-associated protein
MELRFAKTGPTTLVPTGAAYFVYDEAGQLLGEYDANGNPIYETVYLGNTPVGVLKQTGTTASANIVTSIYNVHADHLGTPRVITRQADQAVVWYWDTAEAFGATLPNQNPNGLGTFTFNQRFAGQVYDQETGLFQNWNREYNAQQGRYDQSDPIGLKGGLNPYAYVENNPLSFVDPLGLLKLPNDPSGLPPGWTLDPSHRDPGGQRFRDPNGDMLDWHPGRPGLPGWRGKDHWHHNGGEDHLPPGSEVPDSCSSEPSLFDRLKDYLTPPSVYDPRQDRWTPAPPIFPRVVPLPIP